MDETTEREARAVFNELADAMGPEKFKEFGMPFLLQMEPRFRKTMSADSPVIRMLDEYHRLHAHSDQTMHERILVASTKSGTEESS